MAAAVSEFRLGKRWNEGTPCRFRTLVPHQLRSWTNVGVNCRARIGGACPRRKLERAPWRSWAGLVFCAEVLQQTVESLHIGVVIGFPAAEIRNEIFTNLAGRILAGVGAQSIPSARPYGLHYGRLATPYSDARSGCSLRRPCPECSKASRLPGESHRPVPRHAAIPNASQVREAFQQ